MTQAEGHQQQLEQRQQEEEAAALTAQIRAENAYADAMIRRDKMTPTYSRHSDTAPDGRPLWIGNTPYDEYCAPKGADKI